MIAWLRQRRKGRVEARLKDHLRSRHPVIDVECGNGMFNLKCHENAVQWAFEHEDKGTKVVECIYIDAGTPILHYVNELDGMFIDNTLGFFSKKMEFYYIRVIHKTDWPYVRGEFDTSLDAWAYQFTTWFDRKILKIDRVL